MKPRALAMPCIPVMVAFCPWDERLVLAVGLSNGQIVLYDENWERYGEGEEGGHEMSVNCVNWENQIVVSNRRVEWVKKSITNIEAHIAS